MKLREEESSWNCSTPLKCSVGRTPLYLCFIVELIHLKYIFILQTFMMAASCKSVLDVIVVYADSQVASKMERKTLSVFKGWKSTLKITQRSGISNF